MNNIEKPQISSDFTVEDIHKIRVWHAKRRENMTHEEIIQDIERGANKFLSLVKNSRVNR
ncbi:hypothetical protein FACS1894105_13020 [Clostridia bacterium]|nr:hypothetical protein FACS1894105_13020 [Clostridia bacterium]